MTPYDSKASYPSDDVSSAFATRGALACLRDKHGGFIRVSTAFADLLGAAPEDMIGRGLADFFGSHSKHHIDGDKALIESGNPEKNVADPIPMRNGGTLWAMFDKVPLFDDRNAVVAILVTGSDMSRSSGSDLPVSEKCTLLETVIDCIDAPIAFYGADRRLVLANRTYWEIHDYMGTRDVVRIGTPFEDVTRATCERAIEFESEADREALIERFLKDFENPENSSIAKQKDLWYRHQRYKTPCGGRVTFAFDVSEIKNAELELIESRDFLRTIVENISEMLSLYGPDRTLQFGNRTFWRYHEEGGTAEVIRIGATIEQNGGAMVERLAQLDPDFDADFVLGKLIGAHEGQASEFGFRWGQRDVRIRKYPTPEGGFVLLGYDVTERKMVEAALQTSNERLRDYAESASDWFWEMDAGLRFTWLSARFSDAMGQPREQMYGLERSDLIAPDFDPEVSAAHQEALRRHEPFRDFVFRRDPQSVPVGLRSVRWIKTSGVPVFDSNGTFCGYRGTSSDVTREKVAEQELRESERRYYKLAETAPVGIFRTDSEGACTYHNEIWNAIAGRRRAAWLGENWTDIFPPDERRNIAAAWREMALRNGVYRTEARINGEGGNDTWVLVTIALEENLDGAPSAFIGTLTDISLLKTVELQLRVTQEALRQHRDELEVQVERRTAALREAQQSLIAKERLSAIGQLTATVSHELRNPLGTISASFTALRQRVEMPDEKALSIAARIERSIARCETIIQDLLNYTRIDKLRSELRDFGAWMVRFLGEQDFPSDLTLEVCLHHGSKVCLDRSKMAQAFINVINNATDAMNEDPEASHILEIRSEEREGRYVITFSDDGPGIPPEDLERVFEPLVSMKAFGVGLGLPLVKQIVELHGGSVEIANRKSRGCDVTITLPLEDSAGAKHGSEP